MKFFKFVIIVLGVALIPTISFGQSKKDLNKMKENWERYEVESIKVGSEGTKLIKVWGYGKKVDDAIFQAKRNSVHASIFKGLPSGEGVLSTPPICSDVNALSTHYEYFMNFFKEGGDYIKYIKVTTDMVPSGKDRREIKGGYKVAVYVQVLFDDLKDRLETDGIIRSLNTGF